MSVHETSSPSIVDHSFGDAEHDSAKVPKALTIAVVVTAVTLAVLGFFVGLGAGSTAAALGRGLGTALQPVIPAAIIGWGNERRARIGYLAVAAFVLVLNVVRL